LALSRFDLPTALDYNLLFPPMLLLLFSAWFVWAVAPFRSLQSPLHHRHALRIYVAVALGFWVLRLLPTPWGQFLASTPS
jgi:hypothetical protein